MSLPDQRAVAGTVTAATVRASHPLGATPWWSRTSVRVVGGLLVPVAIVVVWLAVTLTGLVPPFRLPSPIAVVQAAGQLIADGSLFTHIAISTQRVIIGFLVGSVVGLFFAAIVGLTRSGDILLSPLLVALRAVPSLAWVPLLILWLQIGEESKITLIAIGAFFPVFTTVAGALRRVDPQLVEAGRSFGLRGWSLLRTVQLPAVVPSLVSGLRLALAQAWLFLVAAELIASSMGLGWLLSDSGNTGRVDRILLAIVLLALLGTLTNALLVLFERAVLKRWL
ncbi:ABC transporter permease [Microbacterium sp. NEAU-LLB]|uniref:ABC transporter permease n=1 Tax=Microbacterium stercoris TaxID=2820289 RepID=A0A939QIP0_9MICO|nr:ABC transporter permease [Microbacterium stercoris]MBO3664389.1 ABC transporter permease [Microbacterium stercoris]